MGLIKEPLNIDFFVVPQKLTIEEKLLITEFIKADKQKRQKKETRRQKSPPALAKGNRVAL